MIKYFCDYCGKETKSSFEYWPLNIGTNNKVFIDEETKTISYHKYELYQNRKIYICMDCAKSIIEAQNQLSKRK